jgi:hypothetical protein
MVHAELMMFAHATKTGAWEMNRLAIVPIEFALLSSLSSTSQIYPDLSTGTWNAQAREYVTVCRESVTALRATLVRVASVNHALMTAVVMEHASTSKIWLME